MAELIARADYVLERSADEFASIAKTAEETQLLKSLYFVISEASNCGNRSAFFQQTIPSNLIEALKSKKIYCEHDPVCPVPGRLWIIRW